MTELTTANSYIVRIYRVDTVSPKKLTGLLESMDGSGERIPFADVDELAALLNRGVEKRKRGRRKVIRQGSERCSFLPALKASQ